MGECWLWGGARHRHGYGVVRRKGRNYVLHRLVYESCVGDLEPGLVVRHLCNNPPCWRPDHLALGTQYDNVRDTVVAGRNHVPRRRLSDELVRWARWVRLYAGVSYERLGAMLGVDGKTVWRSLNQGVRAEGLVVPRAELSAFYEERKYGLCEVGK